MMAAFSLPQPIRQRGTMLFLLLVCGLLLLPIATRWGEIPPGDDTRTHMSRVEMLLEGKQAPYADLLPAYFYHFIGNLEVAYQLYFYLSTVLIVLGIYLVSGSLWSIALTLGASSAVLGFYSTGTIPNAWVSYGLGFAFLYYLAVGLSTNNLRLLVISLILFSAILIAHSVSSWHYAATVLISIPILAWWSPKLRARLLDFGILSAILIVFALQQWDSTSTYKQALEAVSTGAGFTSVAGESLKLSSPLAALGVIPHYLGPVGVALLLYIVTFSSLNLYYIPRYAKRPSILVLLLGGFTIAALLAILITGDNNIVLDRMGRAVAVGVLILLGLLVGPLTRGPFGKGHAAVIASGILVMVPLNFQTWMTLECKVCA